MGTEMRQAHSLQTDGQASALRPGSVTPERLELRGASALPRGGWRPARHQPAPERTPAASQQQLHR